MPETRIAFADANWLFALYYETRVSDQVRLDLLHLQAAK